MTRSKSTKIIRNLNEIYFIYKNDFIFIFKSLPFKIKLYDGKIITEINKVHVILCKK